MFVHVDELKERYNVLPMQLFGSFRIAKKEKKQGGRK